MVDFRKRIRDLFGGAGDDSGTGQPPRIAKYTLLEELGQGATSTVFRARDPFTDSDVAIKLVRPDVLHDPELAGRCYRLFANEAALVGRLSHPNIVAILDAVMENDLIYLVMEYVDGGTLRDFCSADTLLPVPDLLEIIFKCANALDYACRNGVIHRDVKPANILRTASGDVRISDFGAAIFQQAGDTRTQIVGIGSPAYMSPEQVQGEELSHQTDIFSLGVVMYQLLTGHLPFVGENDYGTMFNVVHKEPAPPRVHRSGVPREVERIVLKALAKTREGRYATWGDFGADLSGVMQHVKISGPSLSEAEKFTTLKRLRFFRHFGDIELWEVLRIATWETLPRDTRIIAEGDHDRWFFVIVLGEVEVLKGGTRLSVLGSGDCFGEMSYIRGHYPQRSADVVSLTTVQVLRVEAESLHKAGQNCQLAFNQSFLQVLVERLERANEELSMRILA